MSNSDESKSMDDVSKVAGVVGESEKLAAEYALGEGAEVATTATLSGEVATLGAGAAFGSGVAIAGGVVAAGALGYEAGNLIEEHTHIGSEAGDFLYDHSNPEDAQAALHHYENAEQEWDEGNYGSAIGEGVESVGSMIEGAASGAYDTVSDAASDALDYLNPFD